MKTQTTNAIAYAQNMLSFLFQHRLAEKIQGMYLFGSAVRGELEKGSDLDLFIECAKKDEAAVRKMVDSAIVRFTQSQDHRKWKLFHFTYPFSVQIGRLKEWDLQFSIASEGIILFSQGQPLSAGERMVLFTWEHPQEKHLYMRVKRQLFGRDEPIYTKTGAIHLHQGRKVCPHTFLVPKMEQQFFIDLLSQQKVNFSMKEITLLES